MQDKTGKRRAVTEAGGSMKMTDRPSSDGGTPLSTWKCSVNSQLLMGEYDSMKWDWSRPIRKHTVRA